MKTNHDLCIYCGNTDPEAFHGREHVIAQAFGKYGDKTPTLDCVCDECNKLFGRDLDTVHARDTPEGILRPNVGLLSSEPRLQKRVKITLDARTGDWSRMRQSIDLTTGKLMEPKAHLVVLNPKTGEYELYRERDIAELNLPDEIYGERQARKWWVFAENEASHTAFVASLQAANIDFRPGERMPPPPREAIDGFLSIEAVIDDIHKRAIAKNLMNLAAHVLGADEVRRKPWDHTRRFVRYGEGKMKARLTYDPFWDTETANNRLSDDSINVAIHNADIGILGAIEFYNRMTYTLVLAEGHTVPRQFGARFTAGVPPIILPLGSPISRVA